MKPINCVVSFQEEKTLNWKFLIAIPLSVTEIHESDVKIWRLPFVKDIFLLGNVHQFHEHFYSNNINTKRWVNATLPFFVIYPNFISSIKKVFGNNSTLPFFNDIAMGLIHTKNRSFDFCPFIQRLTVSMNTEIIWVFIFWKVIQRYDLMTWQQKKFNGKSEKTSKWSHQQMSRIVYGTLCLVFADIKPFLSLQKSEK